MARMLTPSAARHFPLLQLPDAFLQSVLAQLPADQRARLACFCRALRDAAKHPRLWQVVDLTRAGGLTCTRLNPVAILHAMAPQLAPLRVLRVQASAFGCDVSGATLTAKQVTLRLQNLAVVSRALSAALLKRGDQAEALQPELHLVGAISLPYEPQAHYAEGLAALLRTLQEAAFVTLDELECSTQLGIAALSLPRVHVRHVHWKPTLQRLAPEQLFRAMESHVPLQKLTADMVDFMDSLRDEAAVLERVVDVVLKRQLTHLTLMGTNLYSCSAPQLTRLLQDSVALRSLTLEGAEAHMEGCLFDSTSRPLFASALRTNTTLKELTLSNMNKCRRLMPALCAALAGHPSIESLCFWKVYFGVKQGKVNLSTLDKSMAVLLSGNSPALARLHVNFEIGGMAPLQLPRMFSALAGNTHLRALKLGLLDSNAAYIRGSVVPALQANTGLRELSLNVAGTTADKTAVERALRVALRQGVGPWNPPN